MKSYLLALGLFVMSSVSSMVEHHAVGEVLHFVENEFRASESLGNIQLMHDDNGYYIIKDNAIYTEISPAYIDESIRNLSHEQLEKYLGRNASPYFLLSQEELHDLGVTIEELPPITIEETEEILEILMQAGVMGASKSNYILITQAHDGTYILHAKSRMLGGGIWGAWAGCFAGKFIVHISAQAAIMVVSGAVSLVATPAAGAAVYVALTKTTAIAVEATSIAAGLAGGIAGGVITGPV